jgi:hypothetical protein
LTREKGSRELTNRLRERFAPLAMPVSFPLFSVRKDTILSDSPKGQVRNTIAGVTWQRSMGQVLGLTLKELSFFDDADNYLKYRMFLQSWNLTTEGTVVRFF